MIAKFCARDCAWKFWKKNLFVGEMFATWKENRFYFPRILLPRSAIAFKPKIFCASENSIHVSIIFSVNLSLGSLFMFCKFISNRKWRLFRLCACTLNLHTTLTCVQNPLNETRDEREEVEKILSLLVLFIPFIDFSSSVHPFPPSSSSSINDWREIKGGWLGC